MIKFNSSDHDRRGINRATGGHPFLTTGMLPVHAEQHMVPGPFYGLVYSNLEDAIETLRKDCYYLLEGVFPHDFWADLTPAERHMAWGIVLDLIARQAVPLRLTLPHFYDAPYFSLQ